QGDAIMSWMRWFFLGDLGQQLDIHAAQDRLERVSASLIAARGAGRKQAERIDTLERELLRLEASFAVVVRVLRDKGMVPETELERAVAAQISEAEQRIAERETAAAADAQERRVSVVQRRMERRRRRSEP